MSGQGGSFHDIAVPVEVSEAYLKHVIVQSHHALLGFQTRLVVILVWWTLRPQNRLSRLVKLEGGPLVDGSAFMPLRADQAWDIHSVADEEG